MSRPTRTRRGRNRSTPRIPARYQCAGWRSRRRRASRRAAGKKAAEADLRKAQEAAGEAGDDNAQLRSAVAAVEKAELDLARTKVVAPARGVVTDLRTDVGQFAQPGAPVMTLIAMHDLWISADLTENNIGNVKPGAPVAIVLDALPGEVLQGRVRSVGSGVSSGQQAPPERCRRSRTAATGCARRSASRWQSSSIRPMRSACARSASAARPRLWSSPATTS
jgi:hypothetical protein